MSLRSAVEAGLVRAFIVTVGAGEGAESYYLLAENTVQAVSRAMRLAGASKDQIQDIVIV